VVAYIPKATVQAAIGAIPLAAGVASGEVILAVAVLSILLTAPIGAIGIQFVGDRVLEESERSVFRFRELRERLGIPRVGERIRSKRFDTVWKVIEEKEFWVDAGQKEARGGTRPKPSVPAIQLRFWLEGSAKGPGTGKTRSYRYSLVDPPFHDHWEILYDW
jgi:hypothetical protein